MQILKDWASVGFPAAVAFIRPLTHESMKVLKHRFGWYWMTSWTSVMTIPSCRYHRKSGVNSRSFSPFQAFNTVGKPSVGTFLPNSASRSCIKEPIMSNWTISFRIIGGKLRSLYFSISQSGLSRLHSTNPYNCSFSTNFEMWSADLSSNGRRILGNWYVDLYRSAFSSHWHSHFTMSSPLLFLHQLRRICSFLNHS